MNKPFFTANVRATLNLYDSGEISFSMMVKILNDISFLWHKEKCKYEVSLVKCDLCAYQWVAIMPEGTLKLECPDCGLIRSYDRVKDF